MLHLDPVVSRWKLLRGREARYPRTGRYDLSNVTPNMRRTLVEWLRTLSLEEEDIMSFESWVLAVDLVDRLLADAAVAPHLTRKNFQLVGAVCLWIACKMHDRYFMSAEDWVASMADAYPTTRLLGMEWQVMEWLHYSVHSGTVLDFVMYQLDKAGTEVDWEKIKGLVHAQVLTNDYHLPSEQARGLVVEYHEMHTPTKQRHKDHHRDATNDPVRADGAEEAARVWQRGRKRAKSDR